MKIRNYEFVYMFKILFLFNLINYLLEFLDFFLVFLIFLLLVPYNHNITFP